MKKLFLLVAMTAFIGAGYASSTASISKAIVVSCDKCDHIHKCDESCKKECKKECKKAQKKGKKGDKCCASKSGGAKSASAKKACCKKSATAKSSCGAKKAQADSQVK